MRRVAVARSRDHLALNYKNKSMNHHGRREGESYGVRTGDERDLGATSYLAVRTRFINDTVD